MCCEKITKRNVEVTCGFCDYNCCRNCVQNYILSKPVVPACMNCNHEWNNQFLMDVCTKTFMTKDYKKHKEQFLYDLEQVRFPEAQQLIQVRKMRDEVGEEATALKKMYEEKMNEYYRLNSRFVHRNLQDMENLGGGYTRRCPLDGCRGFLSRQWKCGICDKHVCSKCHELKLSEHECNPDSVATAALIRSDSKPCPKCGIYIQKLEGCNQMWCTDCHTAFDWRSGALITGNIHNPHFFEARRAAGMRARNLNDIPCGGLPTHNEFKLAGFQDPLRFPVVIISLVCNIEGKIINMREPNNIDLRIRYMDGDIDEAGFKRAICMADKRYHKQREIDDVYQMASTTISDILRQILSNDSHMDVVTAEQQIVDILNYSNDALKNISKKYSSKVDNTLCFRYLYMNYYRSYRTRVATSFEKPSDYNPETFRFEFGKTFFPRDIDV